MSRVSARQGEVLNVQEGLFAISAVSVSQYLLLAARRTEGIGFATPVYR